MGRAIAVPIREQIRRLHAQDTPAADVASRLRLPLRTVRHLLRRSRLRPDQPVTPDYARCGRPADPALAPWRALALAPLAEHPR